MLGTAQADAFRTELDSLLGVARGIRIGADAQTAGSVSPAHEASKLAGDGRFNRRNLAIVDVAGRAVEGDEVTLVVHLVANGQGLCFFVNLQRAAADDSRATHAASDNRRVRGHAAEDGQDALREVHAFDVLRRGFAANEDNLFLVLAVFSRFVSGEVDAAGGSARGSRQTLRNDGRLLHSRSVEVRVQQGVELLGLHLQHGFFFAQHAFVHQINSNLQRSRRGTLAVTGLQHVQLAAFNGVFHVLHVAIVRFQLGGDVHKLLVHIGHLLLQVGDGFGGTDTSHNVLALSVQQVLTVQLLFARGGVAREGNARAGGFAHVAEDHGLHVDGSAPVARNIVHTAIVDGTRVVPRTEHGLDGFHQLNLGVLREVHAHVLLVDFLETNDDFLQVIRGEVAVVLDALLLLEFVQNRFKFVLRDFHNHVREHGDETAIRVIREMRVVGQVRQTHNRHVRQAQIQNGIHHAGHGGTSAGADRNKERILVVAELLAGHLFGLRQSSINLLDDIVTNHLAVGIIPGAGFGGDGEALRHGHTEIGHLSEVRALAAQQLTHVGVAFLEEVHILLRHWKHSFFTYCGRNFRAENICLKLATENTVPFLHRKHILLASYLIILFFVAFCKMLFTFSAGIWAFSSMIVFTCCLQKSMFFYFLDARHPF